MLSSIYFDFFLRIAEIIDKADIWIMVWGCARGDFSGAIKDLGNAMFHSGRGAGAAIRSYISH